MNMTASYGVRYTVASRDRSQGDPLADAQRVLAAYPLRPFLHFPCRNAASNSGRYPNGAQWDAVAYAVRQRSCFWLSPIEGHMTAREQAPFSAIGFVLSAT
jgi:hypothetical protein